MKTWLVSCLLVATSSAHALEFFENAERRDATARETYPIVKVTASTSSGSATSCTGFFVKNSGNKALIATARHCAFFQLTRWCEHGSALTFKTESGGHEGKCKKVVAATTDQDMALVEAEFENWATISKSVHFLQLSEQRPRLGTKLKMLGYPSDKYRSSEFTVTENCWIHDGREVTVQDYSAEDHQQNQTTMQTINSGFSSLEDSLRAQIKYDKIAFHNCSVYGGNSGGPILVHGTPIVLGMPTSYRPNVYSTLSSKLSTTMDSTAIFVEANKAALQAAGVVLAKPYTTGKYVPAYQWYKSSTGGTYCYRTSDPAGASAVNAKYCEEFKAN